MGLEEDALRCLERAHESELRFGANDLFQGAAGWGMTELQFYSHFGDPVHLQRALEASEVLQSRLENAPNGYCWSDAGQRECGIAHGTSGISLFFLYLYLATGDEQFWRVGRTALNYVLGCAYANSDGASTWFVSEGAPTVTPYWRWGSAGIGMVIARYNFVRPEDELGESLERVLIDADRRYCMYPGRFFGLAGIGEFLVDLRSLYPSATAERALANVLEGIRMFGMERPSGVAFAGEGGLRISSDLGTGGAGVVMLLDRVLTNKPAAYMNDSLLPSFNERQLGSLASAIGRSVVPS